MGRCLGLGDEEARGLVRGVLYYFLMVVITHSS